VRARLDDGDIVLISPLGYSPTGEIFNLALEEVATQVAVRLTAHKLIFLMETEGVRRGRQLLTELSTKDADTLLAANGGKQPPDVLHYLPYAIRACDNGVRRAHLISRHVDGALLLELFTRDGVGTMIASGAACAPAQRDDRRRRRASCDHRAARGAGHSRAPLARAARDGDRALHRSPSTTTESSDARRSTRFPDEERPASSRRSRCIRIFAARATARR
jgi:hypothetical protein